MPETFRFIFESDNANSCTPASISRCGTIYIGQEEVGWQAYLSAWFTKFDTGDSPGQVKGKRKLTHQQSLSSLSSKKKKSKRLIRRQSMETLNFRLEHHHKANDISMSARHKSHLEALCEWILQPCFTFLDIHIKDHLINVPDCAKRVDRVTKLMTMILKNTYSDRILKETSFWRGKTEDVPELTQDDIECISYFQYMKFGIDLDPVGKTMFSTFVKSFARCRLYINMKFTKY